MNIIDSSHGQQVRQLKPDDVVRWYYRLNGFLAMSNFIIHPPQKGSQRTDADVVGIRFPNHRELAFSCEQIFATPLPLIAIAEVTIQKCKVNGPWTNKHARNMQYLLQWIGLFEDDTVDEIAASLYSDCKCDAAGVTVQMYAIGKSLDKDLTDKYPGLKQITFESIFSFIYKRFDQHKAAKANHQQWDETANLMWSEFKGSSNEELFVQRCLTLIGINQSSIYGDE